MSIFNGKSILVTGGTGSFGKRLIKKILKDSKPARLVVFSRDELKQFEMQQWANDPCMRYFLGDVRNLDRLKQAFDGVDIVIHAAAMKQVPAAEYNPMEAINTNIRGAENVTTAAIYCDVKKVIALSTDKACNPANLYGATKLCSDKLFVAANALSGHKLARFAVVRYGNVIGSRGSVIPFFMKKKEEGVIPITDDRMTRFMITLKQGVQFVIDSLERMEGGEIFIPKIPTMTLMELKETIAPECKTDIIGIRPGEKIHEIMISTDDAVSTLEFEDHFVIQPQAYWWNSEKYQSTRSCKQMIADFSYSSDNNPDIMNRDDLQKILNSEPVEGF